MKNELPHVLFILDHLYMRKSGVYALVRWTIQMLRKCLQTRAIRITCTSCKTKKQTSLDYDYVEFMSQYCVKTLHPTKAGYPLRVNETELTVHDLNRHDKQYFRHLTDLSDDESIKLLEVTHAVVAAPLTAEACLNGGIVERIKTQRKPYSVHVIMLNQMYDLEKLNSFCEDLNKYLFCELATVVSIGDRIFQKWEAFLPREQESNQMLQKSNPIGNIESAASSLKHSPNILLYPTFEKCLKYAAKKATSNYYLIVTLHSSHCNMKFLKLIANHLGHVAQRVTSEKKLQWFIQWSHDRILTNQNEAVINELKRQANCDTLEIILNNDFASYLGACSLCIQPGYFDTDGWSGLEILLSGIPTLVMDTSDVWTIVKKVCGGDADFFTCDADVKRNSDKIFERLDNRNDAFKKAQTFQYNYCKFKNEDNFSTVAALRDYLKALTGVNVAEEDLMKNIELFPTERHEIWPQESKEPQLYSRVIPPYPLRNTQFPNHPTYRPHTPLHQEEEERTLPKDRISPSSFIQGGSQEPATQSDEAGLSRSRDVAPPFHVAKETIYSDLHGSEISYHDNAIGRHGISKITKEDIHRDIDHVGETNLHGYEAAYTPTFNNIATKRAQSDTNDNRNLDTKNTKIETGAEASPEPSTSASTGVGAKPKIRPKQSLSDFLKTYKPDRSKPRREHNYKVTVIPPRNPLRRDDDNDNSNNNNSNNNNWFNFI